MMTHSGFLMLVADKCPLKTLLSTMSAGWLIITLPIQPLALQPTKPGYT